MTLDLPLIWAALIALAVLLYVVLDGFDLGVGILFPLARSVADRDTMMATIAPYWDGNETWLVLGGGGLFAAFPLAYSILMPALYLPVIVMLLALILRGVAFEFRLHGRKHGKTAWAVAFGFGSLLAALAQGAILGGFIEGVRVRGDAFGGEAFAGGAFDWATPYTALTAVGLVAGYALLGAGWLMVKTSDDLHGDARRWGKIAAACVAGLLAAVSAATLLVHPGVAARWGVSVSGVSLRTLGPLLPIPAIGAGGLAVVFVGLRRGSHVWPFVGALIVFLSGYLGLGASFFPNIVPYHITFRAAANADNALGLLLIGVGGMLPVILGYTAFVYWLFRGKVAADAGYH
ncbi:MAG: cytochrome d ubiquinol oxidase subunit II [Pseudomonadota bacterium]|nr:cytochrome d ubiquinol oxidase subunit II [Pseudomonadota bacterium]